MPRPEEGSDQAVLPSPRNRERTCLLIVGMHRSGTSALTRVLSLLGADLPQTLMQGSNANKASNATGHWESEAIARFGDLVLDSAGTDWRSPEPVSPSWYQSARYDEMIDGAQTLLQEEFAGSPLFVFKDPRVCKLIPFWLDALEKVGAKTKIVSIIRSPFEVAASLQARNGFESAIGQLLWLRYVLDGEVGSRSASRTFVTYDQLLENVGAVTDKIGASFGLVWPRISTKSRSAISDFLSHSHRHHSLQFDNALVSHQGFSGLLSDVYEIILRWAQEGEKQLDHKVLDQSRREVDRALQLLGEPVYLALTQGSQIKRLKSQCEENKALLKSSHEKAEALTKEIKGLRQSVSSLEKVRIEAAIENREALISLARMEEKFSAAEAAREQIISLSKKLEDKLDAAQRESAKLIASRHGVELKYVSSSAQVKSLQTAIEHLRQDRAKKIAERDKRYLELKKKNGYLESQLSVAYHRIGKKSPSMKSRITNFIKTYGSKTATKRLQQLELLRSSNLFDPLWYITRYEDVRLQNIDPAEHYIDYGGIEGRSPGPNFNGQWYLENHGDVRDAGLNPLLHYLEHGKLEGREISSVPAQGRRPSLPFSQTGDGETQRVAVGTSGQNIPLPVQLSTQTDAIVDSNWRARVLSFSSLARTADESLHSFDDADEAANGPSIATGDELLRKIGNLSTSNEKVAACLWHDFFGRFTNGGQSKASHPEPPLECALRSQLCNGNLLLEDAWFCGSVELYLRFHSQLGTPPFSLRVFQQNSDDQNILCGKAVLVSGRGSIARICLISPYRPLLLVVVDSFGDIVDSMLLPFPSLCRGGTHYAESVAQEAESSAGLTVPPLVTGLLENYIAWSSGDVSFAISDVVIDAAGANGTEFGLSADLITWLANDLGMALHVEEDGSEHILRGMEPGLAVVAQSTTRRAKAARLLLPANAVPTLSVLFALKGEVANHINRSIYMHQLEHLPAYCLAHGTFTPETGYPKIANFPSPAHVADAPSGGVPATINLAICWADPVDTPVETFFPVSAGIALSTPAKPSVARKLSVIVDVSNASADMVAILVSISKLQSEFDIECLLISPSSFNLTHDLGIKFNCVKLTAASQLSRFVKAAALCAFDRLLLLDETMVLHDPRLVRSLWDICEMDCVGTASGALVSETPGAKGISQLNKTAGWIMVSDQKGLSSVKIANLADYALSSYIPIVAPDLRCVMLDKSRLQEYGTDASDELSLGSALGKDGLLSICLNFVTATSTVSRADEVSANRIAIDDRALHIRSLAR